MVRLLDRGLALSRMAFMGRILQHRRHHLFLFICRFLDILKCFPVFLFFPSFSCWDDQPDLTSLSPLASCVFLCDNPSSRGFSVMLIWASLPIPFVVLGSARVLIDVLARYFPCF